MITRFLHSAVNVFQGFRKVGWFVTRPKCVGVHAIPLTIEGKIVLVTLSYAKGWRLPGGGQNPRENSLTAILRELREEIGMTSHQIAEHVSGFRHRPDYRDGTASLFVVRGVRYRPRWSFEVKEVGEFDVHDLPADTAAITRQLLTLAEEHLRAS